MYYLSINYNFKMENINKLKPIKWTKPKVKNLGGAKD